MFGYYQDVYKEGSTKLIADCTHAGQAPGVSSVEEEEERGQQNKQPPLHSTRDSGLLHHSRLHHFFISPLPQISAGRNGRWLGRPFICRLCRPQPTARLL